MGLNPNRRSDTFSIMNTVTVTVRDVCKAWTKLVSQHAGAEVEITSHGKTVAILRILPHRRGQKIVPPNFAARRARIFGRKAIPAADATRFDRENRR